MEKIKNIRGYDVSFQKIGIPRIGEWICAYVNLKGELKEEKYNNETFRELNVIGVDTNHLHNMEQSLESKYKDAERQITSIIEEHILRSEVSSQE